MKGLLIKDLRITMQYKKLVSLMLLMAVMLTFTQKEEGASFIIAYITMICGTLVLTTISVDEFDKSIAFLMAMPIDRSLYATEKYVFSFGCSLIGCVVSSVFCMVFTKLSVAAIFQQAVLVYLILSLFQMVMIPVQLKFGGEMGRMVLIGIVVGAVLLGTVASKMLGTNQPVAIGKEMLVSFIQKIASFNRWGIVAAVVWITCILISLMISRNIMKKKEF